ncbi:YibE/F family protein, partial [Streptomyces sp. NPDC005492]
MGAGDWNGVGDRPRAEGDGANDYGHHYEYAYPPASAPHPGYGPDVNAVHIPSPAMSDVHAPMTDAGHGPDHDPRAGAGGNGHAHSHSHGPAAPVSRHLRKVIAAILIPFTVAVVVGMVVLWPGGAPSHKRTGVGFDRQTQQATVTKVVSVSCASVNASG